MIEDQVMTIPYGIADPESDVVFVVGPQGLIHCLDLESGAIQARTDFAGTPLAIADGTLIGWRSMPGQPKTVRVFAAVQQDTVLRLKWEVTLQLPDWVDVDSPDPNGFMLDAAIQSGLVAVTWEARSRYRGGAPPPSYVEDAETRHERHTVYLEPETGTTVDREPSKRPSGPEQALPELPPTRRIVPYRMGKSWVTQPWRVGSADAFLVQAVEEPGVVLGRQDAADVAGRGEIRLTDAPVAEAAVTPDGGLVFVRGAGTDEPSWDIFSAETGERITSLPFDPGTEEIAVVNDRVLYLVVEDQGAMRRQSLRCRNLFSGERMWSLPLAEQARKAPPPLRP